MIASHGICISLAIWLRIVANQHVSIEIDAAANAARFAFARAASLPRPAAVAVRA
jgi:hypothetical protein